MKIQLLAFGIARDICGSRSFELDIPENTNTQMLQQLLEERYPRLRQLPACTLAVNEEYAHEPTLLAAGDEVAILPPVSGG